MADQRENMSDGDSSDDNDDDEEEDEDYDNVVIIEPPSNSLIHTHQPQDAMAETVDLPSLLEFDAATGLYPTPSLFLENVDVAITGNDATPGQQDGLSPSNPGQSASLLTAQVTGNDSRSEHRGQFAQMSTHPNNGRPLSPCQVVNLSAHTTGPVPFQTAMVQTSSDSYVYRSPPTPEHNPFGHQELVLGPFDMNKIVFSTRTGAAEWEREVRTRWLTYTGWPKEGVVSSRRLAEAGFVYTGFQDKVMCARCQGSVDDWQVGDDPWDQHRKLYQQAYFL